MTGTPCTVILTGSARPWRGRLRSSAASARVARWWCGTASKNLPQMQQGDARRCTPMGPCGAPVVRHAFGLLARLGGIDQQAEPRAGRLGLIGAWHPTLGPSNRGMPAWSGALAVFSSTGSASSTRRSTKSSPTTTVQQDIRLGGILLRYRYVGGTNCNGWRSLVELFQQPCPRRIEHGERAADHLPRPIGQHGAIGVHRRASPCCICGKFLLRGAAARWLRTG